MRAKRLEFCERLNGLAGTRQHTKNVETDLQSRYSSVRYSHCFNSRHLHLFTHRFAQRSALANSNLITVLYTKSWGNMRGQVFVSLLISRVFGYEVEVFPTDDESSVHFGRDDGASENTTADGDFTGKRAFLIFKTHTYQHWMLSTISVFKRLWSRVRIRKAQYQCTSPRSRSSGS